MAIDESNRDQLVAGIIQMRKAIQARAATGDLPF